MAISVAIAARDPAVSHGVIHRPRGQGAVHRVRCVAIPPNKPAVAVQLRQLAMVSHFGGG
eukprot:CAMPEP_0181188522 /NCGR_PEP_ID=MMETSP1096-20121128/11163_1 /TAXON_ID=156174 ORGANISM="Chrysochromulina ericina, Strain CCMP281" /NCGR_SAMPLE_ID=MMETSP1096 /ASSEMBLY_ACC=CAM_ASM_000453 /LENGTH=59 /DNA_ID=CAMNT_0023277593 /DNA_START=992 /DNA_END=1171 /DNA_ORIENTATION=+